MTTQREKDIRHAWSKGAYNTTHFADGAEYARKETADHLRGLHYEYLVGGNTAVCAVLEILIERLEAP